MLALTDIAERDVFEVTVDSAHACGRLI
eukprot:SAG25_NODE_10465_length_333_cov_0.747863_1_plen_27_part_01